MSGEGESARPFDEGEDAVVWESRQRRQLQPTVKLEN